MWKPVPRHEPEEQYQGNDQVTPTQAGGVRDEPNDDLTHRVPRASTHATDEISASEPNSDEKTAAYSKVQQDVEEPSKPDAFQVRAAPGVKHSVLRRVGQRAYLLVVPCILLICAAIGFLAWMWFGNRNDPGWRRLMLGGWSNQAVTISALILRSVLSIFGGIATAMIASVALEQSGSSLQDAPLLSVARFTSPGPDTFLFQTLFHKHFIALPLRALLFLLILTTVAVQFSSTILLYDLDMGKVTGFAEESQNMTGYSWLQARFSPESEAEDGTFAEDAGFRTHYTPFRSQGEYWTGLPRAWNLFAEHSEEPVTHEKIDDTGLTYRAFLPVEEQNVRQSIIKYSGRASVFDARVVCVRPEFANTSVVEGDLILEFALPNVSRVVPELTTTSERIRVQVPYVIAEDGSKVWHILPLNSSIGGMLSSLDASSRQNVDLTYESYSSRIERFEGRVTPAGVWRTSKEEYACGVDLGNAYLIMDYSGGLDAMDAYRGIVKEYPKGERGAWRTITGPPVGTNWATVCFDSLRGHISPNTLFPGNADKRCSRPKSAQYHHIQDFDVSVSGTGNQEEPRTRFTNNTNPLDTPALRKQLGVGNTRVDDKLADRGILKLDSVASIREVVDNSSDQWKAYCSLASDIEASNAGGTPAVRWNPNIYNDTTYPWLAPMALNDVALPIGLCTGLCNVRENGAMKSHTALGVLFNEVIRHAPPGGSPALAMQAVLTQMLRDVYSTWINGMDYRSATQTVPSVSVFIPTRRLGFGVVVAIVLAHLALCMVACVAFAALTKTSYLNNGWQTLADIMNDEDGRRVVEQAGQMRGAEVDEWLKTDENVRRRFAVR